MRAPLQNAAQAARALFLSGRDDAFFAALIGIAAFLLVVGLSPLDTGNIAWLSRQDTAMNYLGWVFFRDGAEWPPAANHGYGMEFGGSILLSDSIPLAALLFKPFASILPQPFQYFGLWMLVCFALQGYFAWRLMRLATGVRAAQLIGVLFFVFAPPFLARTGHPDMTHFTLVGQWMIVAALVLCATPKLARPILWWALLLAAGVLTHPYFVTMLAPLWAADWARRTFIDARFSPRALIEPTTIAAAMAVLIILSGVYLTPDSGGGFHRQGGLGWFLLNVLSPIDANGWSYVLPDIPGWGGEYEGFAYLGAGGLLIVFAALALAYRALKNKPIPWTLAPLAAVLIAFIPFALSMNVSIGPMHFYLPWPEPLVQIGEIFRSTGRYVWPFFYATLAAAIWILSQTLAQRTLAVALSIAAAAQIADTSAGWRAYQSLFAQHGSAWPSALHSPFWAEAAQRYEALRLAPPRNGHPRFRELAHYAGEAGLATDAVYIPRESPHLIAAAQARIDDAIRAGDWPIDTLYVLDAETARRAARTLSREDMLVEIDGLIVLAPGWRACEACTQFGASP